MVVSSAICLALDCIRAGEENDLATESESHGAGVSEAP